MRSFGAKAVNVTREYVSNLSSCPDLRADRTLPKATARNKCFNPTFAAQPSGAAERVHRLPQHNSIVDYFVIRCEKAPLPMSDASGRADRHFARNSPVPGIPLLRDLFACYSAVISPVIPLLIPLLFGCQ